jgi:hypothetical protein
VAKCIAVLSYAHSALYSLSDTAQYYVSMKISSTAFFSGTHDCESPRASVELPLQPPGSLSNSALHSRRMRSRNGTCDAQTLQQISCFTWGIRY